MKLNKISIVCFLVLLCSIIINMSALSEDTLLPIPIPLIGDHGQAGLYFDGLPWSFEADIQSIWPHEDNSLSFIAKGDITALYRWDYNNSNVSRLSVKLNEKDADAALLPGATEATIVDYFMQEGSLYGISETNNEILFFNDSKWGKIGNVNWGKVSKIHAQESFLFSDSSKRPYDYVLINHTLYLMLPAPAKTPILLSVDLETGQPSQYEIPEATHIQLYDQEKLLVQGSNSLQLYNIYSNEKEAEIEIGTLFSYDLSDEILYFEKEGLLYKTTDFQSYEVICTPTMKSMYKLVALGANRLAVYGDTGISIVNTTLSSGSTLRWCDFVSSDVSLFSLANPDITVEIIDGYLDAEEQFALDDGIVDIITTVSTRDLPSYVANNQILDLSSSTKLNEASRNYYPKIHESITHNGALFAVPYSVGIRCLLADEIAWGEVGTPDFPTDTNALYEQIEALQNLPSDELMPTLMENLLADLTAQYIAQYENNLAPINFDTPIYRGLLSHMKAITDRGIEIAKLYFCADSGGYTFGLMELGTTERYESYPFLFPVFEPDQAPKLRIMLDCYAINANSPNINSAMRYLEFASTYAGNWLKYSLSPYDQLPKDTSSQQIQIVEEALHQLNPAPSYTDPSYTQERITALQQKLGELQEIAPEISEIGLSFYRENASIFSVDVPGTYFRDYYQDYLYGSLGADLLIHQLNQHFINRTYLP